MKTNRLVLLFSIIMMGLLSSCKKQCDCKDCPTNFEPPEGSFLYSDEGRTKEMLNYPEIVKMLRTYDTTRLAPITRALGYVDTRVNTYNFNQFKKYLGRIENLSKKAKITIKGISFIAAANPDYLNTGRSYQDLIYIPTTISEGREVAFDPLQSVLQGKLVLFKTMLAENGYNWVYSSKEDFEKGQNENYDYSLPIQQKKGASLMDALGDSEQSGAGNHGTLSPPF